jgi:hypothetical protein
MFRTYWMQKKEMDEEARHRFDELIEDARYCRAAHYVNREVADTKENGSVKSQFIRIAMCYAIVDGEWRQAGMIAANFQSFMTPALMTHLHRITPRDAGHQPITVALKAA